MGFDGLVQATALLMLHPVTPSEIVSEVKRIGSVTFREYLRALPATYVS